MDKSIIDIGDNNIFSIDIKYILSNGTNIKNGIQVENKENNNNEMEDNDDCNLEDDKLSEMK